ncbi:hypothetical protein ACT29H_00950 [Thermophagus sp. OGC60D27]|uniref:hypothetical protein n=1 Tax=Thermophagus sp. OGC60D27 TaxID=3458415 RepID=UPI00403797C5
MRYTFFTLLVCSVLASCTPVRFDQPQPEGARDLARFPKELSGFYVDEEGDTLLVTSQGFEYGFGNMDSECLKRSLLSGNMVLKKYKNYYVLSMQEEEEWDVFLIENGDDGFDLRLIDIGSKDRGKIDLLSKITGVETIKNSEGDVAYFLVRPTRSEFKRMVKGDFFAGREHFRRVEKPDK